MSVINDQSANNHHTNNFNLTNELTNDFLNGSSNSLKDEIMKMNQQQQQMVDGKDQKQSSSIEQQQQHKNENHTQLSIEISAEVQSTIEQVLISDDPLDKSDFNLIAYINELFPNEQSLANIDDVLNEMKMKIGHLDDEIRTVVRRQNITEAEGKEALINAKDVILQLTNRIKTIKEKAKNSQKMVDEITSDIKQLDNAKRNLTSSIVMLNNLHILVEGVSKLDNCINQRNYMQVAAILTSLISVLQQLNKYRNNSHIKKLAIEVDSLKDKLFKQIMNDFDTILKIFNDNDKSSPNSSKQVQPNHIKLLSEACLVIDTLGEQEKQQFFDWFINLQLKEYKSAFNENDEISWLGNVDKRYTWLKRYLMDFEDKFGKMFPSSWEISEHITVEFCKITVQELSKLMARRKNEINVKTLLIAFNKTMNFENLLSVRFTGITLLPKENKDQVIAKLKETNTSLFTGIISHCFEPYLNVYVECQDKQLEKMINDFVDEMSKENKENTNRNDNKMAEVFASSGVLFTQYKNFLVQSVKLSQKRPLVQLANTFQKYLREYANRVLNQSIPKNNNSLITGSATASLMNTTNMFSASGLLQTITLLKEGDEYKFNKSELVQICSVLLTANYCLETIQQLEKKLKEKIDEQYVDKIDMKSEMELFNNIIEKCIKIILTDYIDFGCNSAFNTMIKTQWSNVSTPTGPCPYVNQLTQHLQQIFPFVRENLQDSRKHFAQLCNLFASEFTQKFQKCLFKCKPLKETAAEQLLHDTHTLKKVLLGLPGHESEIKTAPTNYTKTIVKGMTKAETILQVILVPINKVENFISSYIKLMPDSSMIEFQKILEMKDVKKADLSRLCEAYKNEIKSNTTGVEESYDEDLSKIKQLEKLIRKRN